MFPTSRMASDVCLLVVVLQILFMKKCDELAAAELAVLDETVTVMWAIC